jgi:hypothetical protein
MVPFPPFDEVQESSGVPPRGVCLGATVWSRREHQAHFYRPAQVVAVGLPFAILIDWASELQGTSVSWGSGALFLINFCAYFRVTVK